MGHAASKNNSISLTMVLGNCFQNPGSYSVAPLLWGCLETEDRGRETCNCVCVSQKLSFLLMNPFLTTTLWVGAIIITILQTKQVKLRKRK